MKQEPNVFDFSRGFVAFPRSLTHWEWYRSPKDARLFFHLMLTANWKPGRVCGREVPAGGRLASRRTLAEETGLTEMEVRTALKHLCRSGCVTVEPGRQYSLIRIAGWDELSPESRERPARPAPETPPETTPANPPESAPETAPEAPGAEPAEPRPLTHRQPTANPRLTTIKQRKQEKQSQQGNKQQPPSPSGSGRGCGELPLPERLWMELELGRGTPPALCRLLGEARAEGMEEEVLAAAVRRTAENGPVNPLAYLRGVLGRCRAAGCRTMAQWDRTSPTPANRGSRVDRETPSGSDFLRDAALRPFRLYRREGA